MTSSCYYFDDGKSRKFWSCVQRGKNQTIHHGRLGTKGRQQSKSFSSASAAKAATEKQADQKLAKGYIRVDPNQLAITRDKGKRAATEAQVAKLEKQLNAKLPDEYRQFLLTQNGGQPTPDHVNVFVDGDCHSTPVGFIYGLSAKPEPFKNLRFAVDEIIPQLPEGQLPIAGLFNLHYYSISLDELPGCIFYWNEDAGGYEVDEQGQPIFDDSHAVLVAGSFNEFLTRIAVDNAPTKSVAPPRDDETTAKKNASRGGVTKKPARSRLSKRRRDAIIRLTLEGGDELSEAIEQGETACAKFLRQINREIKEFLKTTTNKHELHFFAEHWHWEANTRPLMDLVKNPHIDAGTLLQVFWHGCAEDYYLFHRSASEIDSDFDRYVYRVLRHIERRIVKSDYRTASIPFDPTDSISMWERRDEFARPIPDVLYQPISGRRQPRR